MLRASSSPNRPNKRSEGGPGSGCFLSLFALTQSPSHPIPTPTTDPVHPPPHTIPSTGADRRGVQRARWVRRSVVGRKRRRATAPATTDDRFAERAATHTTPVHRTMEHQSSSSFLSTGGSSTAASTYMYGHARYPPPPAPQPQQPPQQAHQQPHAEAARLLEQLRAHMLGRHHGGARRGVNSSVEDERVLKVGALFLGRLD